MSRPVHTAQVQRYQEWFMSGIFTWQPLNNSLIQWAEPLALWVNVSETVGAVARRQGLVLLVRAQTRTSRTAMREGAEDAELSSDKCLVSFFIQNQQWHFGRHSILEGAEKTRKAEKILMRLLQLWFRSTYSCNFTGRRWHHGPLQHTAPVQLR